MHTLQLTRQTVVDAENNLFSAQLASNVTMLDQLLDDDLIGLAPTGQIITKEMDLIPYKTGAIVIEQASIEIEEIRITGDTALSIVSMKATGTMMEAPVDGHFRYFRVWKRIDNSLKIVGASFLQLA